MKIEKKDIEKVRQAIGLLNSMVVCGEDHSEQSKNAVREAMDVIKSLDKPDTFARDDS